ncbi:MAG: nucleoside deaminase [Gammaproteobacteria bacterium]|nr:nucleoside deaminase [Gammaproteobacteria bacterium]
MFKAEKSPMQAAIGDALKHLSDEGGGPFGACIVKDGNILAVAHNTVLADNDPTCHAEVNAIRMAAKKLGDYDLSGCAIYSTTEPCPMCFSAIHWARIDTIVYGTTIQDVQNLGFNELSVSNHEMKTRGGSSVEIHADFMRDECLELLQQWSQNTRGQTY